METGMIKLTVVRKNRYFDSVFLMQVARRIAGEPGIRDASALLATPANKKVLADLGYGKVEEDKDFAVAGPNDLLIALEGEEDVVRAVASDPEAWLQRPEVASPGSSSAREPHSIREAAEARPASSVAVISVPGEHAAREARAALKEGLNVFLFSSNVSVDDELALKSAARDQGLVVMGPDCGTAYLCGAGIGFANAVRSGPIGIVGSSGTGMQELSSLLHAAGSGISHAIGTGSRDLSDAIGGISTLTAIDALEADLATKVIVILSKPPGQRATGRLMERLATCAKPVILCLLGAAAVPTGKARVIAASLIDDAAELALREVGHRGSATSRQSVETIHALAAAEVTKMRPSQRYVRGLFAGGTFCYQSQAIFRHAGLVVHSNSPLHGMEELADPRTSVESSFVDMGAEVFVEGRPHPMIDATLRRQRLEEEGKDATVAVVLLDFILGAISSRDPVGDLISSVRSVQELASRRGDHLCFVASVCGTDQDAQGLAAQIKALSDAGVFVFLSNAQAAAFCREIAMLLPVRKEKR
jgi:succinyl-CoA synthetase alpha subunit